ncbi:class F sortase [Intrasporangium flavum]|uniref:class F sortase n=1 Tax=Intrasporangium flavum TaxID=1428657 RepID=UPI001A973B54|nr:class F sortase [Intrasporangium flavum]
MRLTRGARPVRLVVGAAVLAALGLAGCGAGPTPHDAPTPPAARATAGTTPGGPALPARVARTAASERVRFRPERVVLPGGQGAVVDPASTVDGVLAVPADIRRVGWWDGSAWAGDPFGTVVVAGHLDAPGQGLGFFKRLGRLRPGDTVTLEGAGHRAAYRVASVRAVAKTSVDASSPVFDQRGAHRLVLLTCAGHFDRATRSYDENLVVTALPAGAAR